MQQIEQFMEEKMNNIISLIGRILLTLIFLLSGFQKIPNFSGTKQYMSAAGMPLVDLFLVAAIIIEIVGAILIMIGFKTKWAALVLIIFMIPTTLIFHTNFSEKIQMIMFLKNLSMIGGLLMIAAFGGGDWSLDARKKK